MRNWNKIIIIISLFFLISCYHSTGRSRYYNLRSQMQTDTDRTEEIDALIRNARLYFDLGLYELSYQRVYDALLLLLDKRDIKPEKYNELMDMALLINFQLRDKVSFRADIRIPESRRPHAVQRDLDIYNKEIFPLEIANDKSYLSDAFINTVYIVGSSFIPFFKHVLLEYDVPVEFALLPLIESGFDSNAISPKGATGMWQFMEATALSLGLNIDYWVDKRYDPFSSAHAAAAYLRYLYERFEKWELALAAYNCGETRLARIIERIRSDDIADLLNSTLLPNETRNYIRSFIYLIDRVDLSHFGLQHNIRQVNIPFSIRIADLLKFIDMSEYDFYYLNPDIKRGIIPYSKEGYKINIYTHNNFDLDSIDEEYILNWKAVYLEEDMSIDELTDYLDLPRAMIKNLGNPTQDGMIKKGTRFVYPR